MSIKQVEIQSAIDEYSESIDAAVNGSSVDYGSLESSLDKLEDTLTTLLEGDRAAVDEILDGLYEGS